MEKDISVREAGRRGGTKTVEKFGRGFFQKIGKKGGLSVSKDREHMAEIGRKGGMNKGKK